MRNDFLSINSFIFLQLFIYLFGWILFLGNQFGNIFLGDNFLNKKNSIFKYFFLTSSVIIFISFIISIFNVFKESRKAILFFNIGTILLIINFSIRSIQKKLFIDIYHFLAFAIFISLFLFSIFLVNYYKFKPINNEIEELGKS